MTKQQAEEQIKKIEPITNHKEDSTSNIERLAKELEETNALLRYTFSFRVIIMRGLLTGLAIVVGSTVFASIVFAIIRVIFGDIPFVPSDIPTTSR